MKYEKLIQNIELLSAQKGIKKTNALIESGVGKNFLFNINRGSDPSTEKIQQLATYFNVSTDYLLGNTDNPQNPKVDVDLETAEAMELFKNLSREQRDNVLGIMRGLSTKK